MSISGLDLNQLVGRIQSNMDALSSHMRGHTYLMSQYPEGSNHYRRYELALKDMLVELMSYNTLKAYTRKFNTSLPEVQAEIQTMALHHQRKSLFLYLEERIRESDLASSNGDVFKHILLLRMSGPDFMDISLDARALINNLAWQLSQGKLPLGDYNLQLFLESYQIN